MHLLYLGVFVVLIAILLVRIPAAVRSRESWMTWLAVLLACMAIMTLGPVVPIRVLDSWLGETNVVWLVQCILATFAFWAFSEAAKALDGMPVHPLRTVVAPTLWCVGFTVPFFLNTERGSTVEHFSRVHSDSLATYVSALIYMGGLCWLVGGMIRSSRGHYAIGHILFRVGGLGVILGCICETIVMTIDHFQLAEQRLVQVAYWGFDVLFYPGVICIAAGMAYFYIRRLFRARAIRRRADALRELLHANDLALLDGEVRGPADTYTVYALLIRINDHRILGNIALTPDQERTVEEAETWVESDLPQMIEATG